MAEDRQIRAIVRGITSLTERVIRKITLDATANLIETTPVDLGWARANWVPAIGEPADDNGVSENPSPTDQDAANARSRQDAATASVALGYRLPQGSVFVSNNVPYVPALNDGSSRQQPAGFVQRAIAKAVTRDIRGLR